MGSDFGPQELETPSVSMDKSFEVYMIKGI